jgi:hypothetical protein
MKKIIVLAVVIGTLVSFTTHAQFKDVQLHYETGSFKAGDKTIKRDFFKTKLQVLNRDSLGLTYINTELDYNSTSKGMSFSQFTLLRSLKLPVFKYVQPSVGHAAALGRDNMYFAGVLVPARFGKVVVLPLFLYSYTKAAKSADARILVGVNARLFNDRVVIFGFASTWTSDKMVGAEVKGKKIAWQFTPQIWFHLNKSIAIGTKLDYSRNHYTVDGTNDFMPTAGLRWVY